MQAVLRAVHRRHEALHHGGLRDGRAKLPHAAAADARRAAVTARLPGFTADASLGPGGAYRAGPVAPGGTPSVIAALARWAKQYGCSCGMKECCCRTWAPGGDIITCCPRDGEGSCYAWVESLRGAGARIPHGTLSLG